MTLQQDMLDKTYLSRALEVSIHVGLFILLATACLLILRPFLPLTAWGIVIAIAVYPGYAQVEEFPGWTQRTCRGRLHSSSISSSNCAGCVADRIIGRGRSEFGSTPQ